MTVSEFILEFNLLYDNIAGEGAPGIDNHEISVYLTTAQEELVKNFYSGNNQVRDGFENSEKRRRDLNELVVDYRQATSTTSSRGIDSNSIFFEIPSNVFYIINEQLTLSGSDACTNGKKIMIKPITHDEYLIEKNNPFRKPNKRKAWRMDISSEAGKPVVEVITSMTGSEYHMRYIKKPLPIVVSNFEDATETTAGLGLTVDGVNTITECELNQEIHREILNRAVELAIRDYRENSLKSKIETNNRII